MGRIGLALILATTLVLTGCQAQKAASPTRFMLFATPDKTAEFTSAFAIESGCHGLDIVTLDGKALPPNATDVRVHYYGEADASRTMFSGSISGANPNATTDVDFFGDCPQQAVQHACAILKGQGGKV